MPVVLAAASRGLKAFRDAFSARAVLVGCLGSVLLVLGSLTPAYLPRTSPLTRAMASYGLAGVEWTWIGTAITMAGLALMLEFWLRVRPARRESRGQPQLRHWANQSLRNLSYNQACFQTLHAYRQIHSIIVRQR